ncbi:VOC family protein [Marinactinospora rubrisoli]|uniref:VOC family protein n=1 Tax=Marinactinospora rubrisoli TaxID=2715399 RepID=A0ABW2KH71_9ACTN
MTETPSIIPVLRYHDARAAIEFLTKAFGFTLEFSHPEVGERVDHAELRYGNGIIMVGSPREGADPALADPRPQAVFVVVPDPDEHHRRAVAAGAEIVGPPEDMPYGAREYMARDPAGNCWAFGTYWRDESAAQSG